MRPEELIEQVLSSPFVDGLLWQEGLGRDRRDPSAARLYLSLPVSSRPRISHLFDCEYYLENNPDVRAAGADPFLHFVTYGCPEGRSPHPLINVAHIRKIDSFLLPQFPSTQDLYEILHYDIVDPSPYFSVEYYREQLKSGSMDAVGLLEDFLKSGLIRGLKPNPLFNPLWYYRQLEGAHDVWSGLRHFVMRGDKEAYAPSPDFSARQYHEHYPDVAAVGTPALLHYLTVGKAEGRSYISEQGGAAHVSAELITRTDATTAIIDEAQSVSIYAASKERINRRRQNRKDRVSVPPLKISRFVKPLSQIDKMILPRFDRPQVSILIPMYNELPYTVECISSILDSNPNVSYEVVVADDASTDDIVPELQRIPNIKYLRQTSNAGFLRNCNAAFHSCGGQYLLLLNNDAQLLPGALDALVEVLAHLIHRIAR